MPSAHPPGKGRAIIEHFELAGSQLAKRWAIVVMLVVLAGLFALDLLSALRAEPCGAGPAADCFPWGGEGPVAGSWAYASKAHYVTRSGLVVAASLAQAAWHLWRARQRLPLRPRELILGLVLLLGPLVLLG